MPPSRALADGRSPWQIVPFEVELRGRASIAGCCGAVNAFFAE